MIEDSLMVNTEEQLRDQILNSLKRRADVNDLTLELCKKTGWDWNKSTAFIQSIQVTHGSEIEILWSKIFSIAGIVCIGIGLITVFYLFDLYIGWNYAFTCLQSSLSGGKMAASQGAPLLNCMAVTILGMLEAMANNGGYFTLILLAGGITGFSLAQRQLKLALEGK
jgi:hypothetical protein